LTNAQLSTSSKRYVKSTIWKQKLITKHVKATLKNNKHLHNQDNIFNAWDTILDFKCTWYQRSEVRVILLSILHRHFTMHHYYTTQINIVTLQRTHECMNETQRLWQHMTQTTTTINQRHINVTLQRQIINIILQQHIHNDKTSAIYIGITSIIKTLQQQ
jgi:hypothetical protein